MALMNAPSTQIAPTSDVAALPRHWDVIVIGAGPAGATAASEMAQKGHSVLLLDKSRFPRPKICGCCLNATTLSILSHRGINSLQQEHGAVPLSQLQLLTAGKTVNLVVDGSAALSRSALDAVLVRDAIARGAVFIPAVHAFVGECERAGRIVELQTEAGALQMTAAVVLVADGLNGRALERLTGFSAKVSATARVGAGVIAARAQAPDFYENGIIYMACTDGGYVGFVRLEDGQLDIAAAFDLLYLQGSGGPANAAASVMTATGLTAIDGLRDLQWQGTAALTRRRAKIAGERLFVIGDSAAYAEPFTGEGISWALRSAMAAAQIAHQAVARWQPEMVETWQHQHRQAIGTRHTASTAIARMLRQSELRFLATRVLDRYPGLAAPIIRHVTSY